MQQEYHAAGERSVSSTAHRVRSKTDKYAVVRMLLYKKYFMYTWCKNVPIIVKIFHFFYTNHDRWDLRCLMSPRLRERSRKQ